VITNILKLLPASHRFVAPVSRAFCDFYEDISAEQKTAYKFQGRSLRMSAGQRKTSAYCLSSVAALRICLDEAAFRGRREQVASCLGARSGRTELIVWSGVCNGITCAAAAASGRIRVLEWLRGRGGAFDDLACYAAAKGGQLGVLRWLRERGCPWSRDTCRAAAQAGHVELLRWAIESGCPYERGDVGPVVDPGFHRWLEDRENTPGRPPPRRAGNNDIR